MSKLISLLAQLGDRIDVPPNTNEVRRLVAWKLVVRESEFCLREDDTWKAIKACDCGQDPKDCTQHGETLRMIFRIISEELEAERWNIHRFIDQHFINTLIQQYHPLSQTTLESMKSNNPLENMTQEQLETMSKEVMNTIHATMDSIKDLGLEQYTKRGGRGGRGGTRGRGKTRGGKKT